MLTFNPTLDFGHLLTAAVLLIGFWRWTAGQQRRDQKIDIVLFGNDELKVPGLIKDVADLKTDRDDIFDHLGRLGINRRTREDRRGRLDRHESGGR